MMSKFKFILRGECFFYISESHITLGLSLIFPHEQKRDMNFIYQLHIKCKKKIVRDFISCTNYPFSVVMYSRPMILLHFVGCKFNRRLLNLVGMAFVYHRPWP